jgi:hypothetical protein
MSDDSKMTCHEEDIIQSIKDYLYMRRPDLLEATKYEETPIFNLRFYSKEGDQVDIKLLMPTKMYSAWKMK